MEKLNFRLSYGRDPKTNEVAILKENHYYPFGLEHQGYVGTHKTIGIGIGKVRLVPVRNYLDDTYRYDFNAKEHQPELGLNWHDYHARNYDAALGRWMNVDPLAEKYFSISPYVYVANNPLKFVDPEGKEIVIIGSDGEKIKYSPSMVYKGDKFTSEIINQLNDIYSVEQGEEVLSYMVLNDQIFTITNEIMKNHKSAVGVFPDDSAGTLKLGNLDEIGINILSHELFHGYQNMKGQGGTSIKNEVEAYLFGDLIERIHFNLNENRLSSIFESGSFDWFDLSRDFTENSFSQESFQKLIDNFKDNSGANTSGLYDRFPLQRKNQSKNLYQEFHSIK